MILVGHTVSMGEMRNIYTILVGKSVRKTPRGMLRSNGNIRMYFVKWSARVWFRFVCLMMELMVSFCEKLTKPSKSIQSKDHFNGQTIMTGNCTRWILGFMGLFSALTLNLFILNMFFLSLFSSFLFCPLFVCLFLVSTLYCKNLIAYCYRSHYS